MTDYIFTQIEKNHGLVTNAPSTKVNWVTGRNIRFGSGYVRKTPGKTLLTTIPSTSPIRAIFPFKSHDNVVRTIVCSDVNIYAYTNDFGTYIDITPPYPPPSITANDAWQFALVGGLPILTQGVDTIWKWANYSLGLTALDNAPTRAKCLTASQNRLLLGWILEDGYEFPARVRWSDIANPEQFVIDKTGKGGRADMVSPNGNSIDAQERIKGFAHRGNNTYILSERNVWLLSPIASTEVYRLSLIAEGIGLISTRAIVQALGIIYFIGQDDFYIITDSVKPIGFPIRNSVFPNLNKSATGTAFAFYKSDTKEVFFCMATASNTTPDTAYVYNTEFNNWSICSVNYLCYAYNWVENNVTWESQQFGQWDQASDSDIWDTSDAGIIPYNVVGNINGEILKLDDGNDDYFGGKSVAIDSSIETGDMIYGSDIFNKMITRVWLFLKPQSSKSKLMVSVGVRNSLSDDIEWSSPMPFTLGVSNKIDTRKTGKYIRLKFSTNQLGVDWTLDGYQLNYVLRGYR